MNSYDIVANAVKEYVEFLMDMDWRVDHAYIAHFYQSYKQISGFEECTEICYYMPGDDTVDFEMDFCEGQKYVRGLSIIPLYKVGQFLSKDIHISWPFCKDNDYMTEDEYLRPEERIPLDAIDSTIANK